MANRVLEFLLQTKKQGDAVAEITEESKKLADTLRNKVTLAMSETEQASRKLSAAQEKLAASSDPDEQAKLTHEVNKARVAMDNAQAKADKYSDELNGVGLASKQAGDAQAGMGISLTDLKSGLDLASQGLEVLKQGFDATIGKAAQWGDDMGDLAQVTGQSVEATSEMAASLELLGVSSDKLGGIIKTLTKNGLQLNMETLIKLSKQYQALKDPVEQNEFLFKNFGRAAEDMAEVMGKSTEELMLLGEAARTSGKVIGEEAAAQAEQLNMQMAILQQKAEGAAIALGNVLVPATLDFIDTNDEAKGSMLAAYGITQQTTDANNELAVSYYGTSSAAADAKSAVDDIIPPFRAAREETIGYSHANDAAVTALRNLQATQEGWASSTGQDVINALKEAGVKGREYELALIAIDEQLGTSFADDAEKKQKLDEITQAYKDGQLSVEEYKAQLNLLYTKDMPETKAAFEQARDAAGELEERLDRLKDYHVRITTEYNTIGTPPGYINPAAGDIGLPGGDSGTYNPTPGQEITPVDGAYAVGGSTTLPGTGSTDRPYVIMGTPGEHVQFTPPGQAPRGGGGGDIHIHIGSVNASAQNDVDVLLQRIGAAVRQATQGGYAYVGAR